MKTLNAAIFVLCSLLMISCNKLESEKVEKDINASSPTPTVEISEVSLTPEQKGYVESGNNMAFKFLQGIYDNDNVICSPLSLQYALSMVANGASGETLQEITDFLGYGEEGIEVLNQYCKILMEQLPAVDLDVTLKVVNGVLVNEEYPLLSAYENLVEQNYYAAVENMNFSDPERVAARINDWANRSTNGYIDNVLEPSQISDEAVAFIMNALYFKSQWAGNEYEPMFLEDNTISEDFYLANGSIAEAEMMRNTRFHQYAEMDGYKVLVLPYAQGKYNMYIILPDENDIDGLITKLQSTAWSEILAGLKQDAKVHVKLPKFTIENKFDLKETLMDLGIVRAFNPQDAQFDKMFDSIEQFMIGKVIQKSKIGVSEWGTEAGSVTVIETDFSTDPGDDEYKEINFHADHPFIFVIGEKTSGTILFEGVVARP